MLQISQNGIKKSQQIILKNYFSEFLKLLSYSWTRQAHTPLFSALQLYRLVQINGFSNFQKMLF